MNNKATSNGCNGAKQGSNCVIWTGQPISALGIEKGDSITDIVCTIAQQVVTLAAPLDLSTVSIQCLIDQLDIDEPAERTIANMLQIAYDSSCDLKTLIDAINAKLSNQTPSLVLNLGCLATFDIYGNPQPYNEQSVLQTLINTACGQQTIIAGLSGSIQALQADVTALEAVPVYVEPTLSSCLFSGRQTSDALILTASALCTYMGQVGQSTDIQSALSQMPSAFTTAYGLKQGWIVNPANMAQSYSNALIVIADLYNQINVINNTCCQISCDKVIVDFDIKLSSDRTMATLFFATKSSVPPGFTEVNPLGSKLIVTDSNGNEYDTYIKVISQLANADGVVIDLTNSPIDPSLDYTFSMSVTLTNGSLTCVKCISHSVTFKDTCAFCQVTVTSPGKIPNPSDKVVLVYTVAGNSSPQATTVAAGTTQVIPATAQISSLIVYGQAQYSSTCTLPDPTTPTCYEMSWGFSKSSGNADAVFTDARFISLSVLGIAYPIGIGNDIGALTAFFANFYPATVGLIGNPTPVYSPSAQIFGYKLYFLTTADIAATIEGYIGNPTNPNGAGDSFDAGAYFKPIPVDASNCPSSGSSGGSQA